MEPLRIFRNVPGLVLIAVGVAIFVTQKVIWTVFDLDTELLYRGRVVGWWGTLSMEVQLFSLFLFFQGIGKLLKAQVDREVEPVGRPDNAARKGEWAANALICSYGCLAFMFLFLFLPLVVLPLLTLVL